MFRLVDVAGEILPLSDWRSLRSPHPVVAGSEYTSAWRAQRAVLPSVERKRCGVRDIARSRRCRSTREEPELTTVNFEPSRNRLLLVEDDHDLAESLVELLESEGFDVRAVDTAAAALSTLSTFAADAALIDVRLGRDNGVELLARLRASSENLVCILMTAYADVDSAVGALRNGAGDYFKKPLDPVSLPHRLRQAIDTEDARVRQERAQRLQTMGSLCAAMAHDINNYLQVIHFDAEAISLYLQSSPPDLQQASQAIESLNGTVHSAAAVCARVLAYGRGDKASHSDATLVLQHCQALLGRLTRSHSKVVIHVTVPEGPIWVPLGAVQLEQVVLNLAVNACQAIAGAGSVHILAELALDLPVPRFRLRVSDTGEGIAPDVLPRVFEPYFSTKRGAGTGLGLAIVQGMVKAVGGDVSVDSTPGGGATFTVMLPRVDAPDTM